ncbi:hypothetical protein ACFL20_13695, partial [Spirochaetota bacterium]
AGPRGAGLERGTHSLCSLFCGNFLPAQKVAEVFIPFSKGNLPTRRVGKKTIYPLYNQRK